MIFQPLFDASLRSQFITVLLSQPDAHRTQNLLHLLRRIILAVPAGYNYICILRIQRFPLLINLPNRHTRHGSNSPVRQILRHPVDKTVLYLL